MEEESADLCFRHVMLLNLDLQSTERLLPFICIYKAHLDAFWNHSLHKYSKT